MVTRPDEALRRALPTIRGLAGEISFVILDDPAMRNLNRRYLGRNRATDVLAFDLGPGGGPSAEVLVSADTARRQAMRRRVPVWMELVLYLLHGALHLAGYDDEEDGDFRRMRVAERRLLARIGIDRAIVKRLVPDAMVL